jgi:putative tricarboxylic transport membrane protein
VTAAAKTVLSVNKVGAREGIVWAVIGGLICLLSWRIDLGNFHEPGPGFVAFAAGVSLVIIGAVMIFSWFAARRSIEGRSGSDPRRWWSFGFRPAHAILLLIGYGLVLQTLGYLVTTFLAMLGLFYDRGSNRFFPSVLASLLTVVSTYLIFETWLRVQLPRGIFPWW